MSFSIRGEDGEHVSFRLDEVHGFPNETTHWGGYDARVQVSLHAGGISAIGRLYTTTGEIHAFWTDLRKMHGALQGTASFRNYEHNLQLDVSIGERGNVTVSGSYQPEHVQPNRVEFELDMDQTYLNSTLNELAAIAQQYGGAKGIRP